MKGSDKAEPKFEDAIKRLEEIVEKLEGGELELDRSLEIFEEGVKLSRWCSRKLDEAEKRIEILVKGEGEEPTPRPFEPEGTAQE